MFERIALRARKLQAAVDKLPEMPRSYVLAGIALIGAIAVTETLFHTLGSKASLAYALIYFLLIACAAWLGYGPGLLVCAITTFILPPLLLGRASHVDPGRFGLLIVISLLISRLSASQRRAKSSLRHAAERLENRVQERTLELQQQQESLKEQAQLLELAPDAILSKDQHGRILFWNRGAEQTYGWSREEAVGQVANDLLKTAFADTGFPIDAKLLADGFWQGELTQLKKDGTRLAMMSRWALRRDSSGVPNGALEINTDITGRRRIEEQLHHTQKLEGIGRLAGGVAHDFNNLLTVINGYTEILIGDLPRDPSKTKEVLSEIRAAGDRAAGLTQQLLAFSRKQMLQPAIVNVNDIVTDFQKMLRRLIPENIEIALRLSPGVGNIKLDVGQLQQIIMNLAVNARDAMPSGGSLLLETANATFDEAYRETHPEVHPGKHVMVAITDTGTGMTEEVKDRLFEPFFTTKPQGVGTGLGLATVYGMVKQNNGWIWVYSELGNGTAFKIYFPRTDEPVPQILPRHLTDVGGHETILVVEDQAEVRKLAVRALEGYGYNVLAAANGDEAIALCEKCPAAIDLLLTDVVMPGMGGDVLAERLTKRCPGLAVLFVSGYTEGAFSHRGILQPNASYLQKPFTPRSLAEKVRDLLGRGTESVAPGRTGSRPVAPEEILIVDDDEAVRKFIGNILTGVGYSTTEVAGGRPALDRLQSSNSYALVICDLVMPDGEGLETIRTLRLGHPHLKIIAISGAFNGQFLEVAEILGACTVLRKPLSRDEVLHAVRGALGFELSAGTASM